MYFKIMHGFFTSHALSVRHQRLCGWDGLSRFFFISSQKPELSMLKTFPILDMFQYYHASHILSDYHYCVGNEILQSWFCIHLNYRDTLIQRRHIFYKWHFLDLVIEYILEKKSVFVTPLTLVLFKFKIALLDLTCVLNICSLIKIIIDFLVDVGNIIPIFCI